MFPALIFTNVVTSLASGAPRRGAEGLVACATIALLAATPLAPLAVGVLAASALLVLAMAFLMVYTVFQIVKPRLAYREYKLALLAPPLGGVAAALSSMVSEGGAEVLAALAVVGFSSPTALVLSPVTVGNVYRIKERWRLLAQLSAYPAALSPLAYLAWGVDGLVAVSVTALSLYLAVMAVAAARSVSGGARGYIALSHLSAFAGTVGGALAALYAGSLSDIVIYAHVVTLGFLMPHALLHITVRGGEIPFTVKRRFWPYPSPLMVAASSIFRPIEPGTALALVVAALLLEVAAIGGLNPVPPAYRVMRASRQA